MTNTHSNLTGNVPKGEDVMATHGKYSSVPVTISTKEAARILGLSSRTVQDLTYKGTLKSSKIGGSRRIHMRPLFERYGLDAQDVLRALNEQ